LTKHRTLLFFESPPRQNTAVSRDVFWFFARTVCRLTMIAIENIRWNDTRALTIMRADEY
jgi:hypothetical protein